MRAQAMCEKNIILLLTSNIKTHEAVVLELVECNPGLGGVGVIRDIMYELQTSEDLFWAWWVVQWFF